MALKDDTVRELIDPLISKRHPGAFIVHELPFFEGKTRVDLGVVREGIFGYEIKGDRDNIKRLKGNQAARYSAICRRVTLVVSQKDIWRAERVVPDWWELIAVMGGTYDDPYMEFRRDGHENHNIDKLEIVRSLWKEELIQILGLPKRYRGKKEDLAQVVASSLSLDEVYTVLEKKLRHRVIRDNRWGAAHGVNASG